MTSLKPANENKNWGLVLLLLLAGVFLGNSIAIILMAVGVKWDPLGFFPVFGIFGGTIGGMAAGMIQVFSWKIPRSLNYFLFIILIISLVIQLILGYSLWLIFVPILGMVYSLIVFAVTIAICAQLKKSPVNWWLFYLILVIGVIISIVSMGFFTTFSDGFLSQ